MFRLDGWFVCYLMRFWGLVDVCVMFGFAGTQIVVLVAGIYSGWLMFGLSDAWVSCCVASLVADVQLCFLSLLLLFYRG